MSFCYYCNSENSDNSKFCRKCGKMMVFVTPDPVTYPENEPRDKIVCANCGNMLEGEARFCVFCGAAYRAEEYPVDEDRKKKCLHCGQLLPCDAVVCMYCGKNTEKKTKQKKIGVGGIIAIILISLILCVTGLFLLNHFTDVDIPVISKIEKSITSKNESVSGIHDETAIPVINGDHIESDGNNVIEFLPWEKDDYTFIGATNAALGQQMIPTEGKLELVGIYLYDENNNFIKSYMYKPEIENNTKFFFDINEEVGYVLTPGTTYKYAFYASVGDKDAFSRVYTFTTKYL